MQVKKIVPCMDIKNGKIVKGIKFADIKAVADPVEMAGFYSASGADELVFYDITASVENRSVFYDLLKKVKAQINIPLTVGGGVFTLQDMEKIINCGADKVSVNSGALKNPAFLEAAAKEFGSERLVFAMDAKKVGKDYHVFSTTGLVDTEKDAIEWAKEGAARGAGEIVLNSIDMDGVREGYDLDLLQAVSDVVSLPLVASGGAGKPEDFLAAFQIPHVDSGLAASIFHYKDLLIPELKAYLEQNGVAVSR